ncbi:MAG: 2-dehydro-3-deoxyglucarate aldolase [Desulfarculaceae bacterium]|nr:2-dehydro-3-deoxyglucarate aldolase [Desulfarculaceae bacterium]
MTVSATSLKQKLASGQLTLGSWITLGHPAIAEIMARAGFDWLTVDLEHSTITLDQAGQLIRVCDLCGAPPLVRLSANDPVQIKRVMDAGAHGIIVPMVNSAQEAADAVAALRYPPDGTRGVGLARAQGYGVSFEDYRAWLAEEALVIAQIEHIRAVENLEAILAVDGVDGFIVGPYDLSGSLGRPGDFEHPDMLAAMERITQVVRRGGKPGGLHVVEPDPEELQRRADQGYRFLAYSVDIRMLDVACRQGLRELRPALAS